MYRILGIACWIAVAADAAAVEPDGFERADLIVVARVVGPAEWDKRTFYYEDGTVVPEETLSRRYWFSGPVPDRSRQAFWMPSVRFEPVLVLKGEPAASFRYTNSYGGTPTMGKEPARTPPGLGGISTEDPTGKLFLLCLEKQTPNGRLTAGIDHEEKQMYMEARFADEYIDGHIYAVNLPNGQYVIEGTKSKERWSSIVVQAWQKEPDRPIILMNLRADRYPWSIGPDGTKVPFDTDFARLAQEKLVPRLYSRTDASLLDKIRANYWSWWLTTNTDKFFPEYKRLIEELDRTWAEPNAPPSNMWQGLDGLYGPESFIRSLVSARTDFLRHKAVQNLPVDHANLRLIVDRLRIEPTFHVQLECCSWLSQLRHKEYPLYADAPNAAWDRNTITNIQAIIDYWSGKFSSR